MEGNGEPKEVYLSCHKEAIENLGAQLEAQRIIKEDFGSDTTSKAHWEGEITNFESQDQLLVRRIGLCGCHDTP